MMTSTQQTVPPSGYRELRGIYIYTYIYIYIYTHIYTHIYIYIYIYIYIFKYNPSIYIHTCCLQLVPYLCGVDPDYDDVHTADGTPVRVQGAQG